MYKYHSSPAGVTCGESPLLTELTWLLGAELIKESE